MVFIAAISVVAALCPLSLAMMWPLPAVCLATFAEGVAVEAMMVQWTVALARNIPPGKLARVAGYDALGSLMATPVGALAAGPLAAGIGVAPAQYLAAGLIAAVSLLAVVPRGVRAMRSPGTLPPVAAVTGHGAGSGPSTGIGPDMGTGPQTGASPEAALPPASATLADAEGAVVAVATATAQIRHPGSQPVVRAPTPLPASIASAG